MVTFRKKPSRNLPSRRRSVYTTEPLSLLEEQSRLFKRNRTLTGSMSSRVASASELSGKLKSPRVQVHELANKRRRVGGIFLIVLAASIVIAILLSQLSAKVSVALTVPTPIDTTVYERSVQEYLGGHPFERLRFALDLGRLTEYLRQNDPEVDTVTSVAPIGFAASQVTIKLRQPLVGWKIGTKQYFVDASGVSFTKNYGSAPAIEIVDQSGVQLEAGSAIASNRFLGYVGRTVALAAAQHLDVEQVIIPLGTTREIELRIRNYAYPVRLSIDRGVGEQVEDMTRALHYFSSRGQTPAYVDVRVGGKAYYR